MSDTRPVAFFAVIALAFNNFHTHLLIALGYLQAFHVLHMGDLVV